jgi:pimeloyl-ACP methyl ester carboxylesterase
VLGSGLQFILYTAVFKKDSLGEEVLLQGPAGPIPVLVYPPKKKEKGLIITLTGFAMQGYRDKRVAAMNHAYARMGYRVLTPQINTIDALCIHPNAIDELKNAILTIASHPEMNPNGFVPAIFAPSFTGGIAALALAELPKNTAASLCLLGAYTDFETTIQFALSNPNQTDDYGMHILFKNFLKYELGVRPDLEALIQTALEDNGLKRKQAQLPALLQKTSPETKELYARLLQDSKFREETLLRAWKKIPDFDTWKNRLDVSLHAHQISCKVSIIHGKEDDVIPVSQSVLLYHLLKKHNPQVRLEVSQLISHGDPKYGFKMIGELMSLGKAFGYFLDQTKF